MNKMNEETKNKIIAEVKLVMEINLEDYDEATKINTISDWDSFNNLMLISKFQEIFNIEFTAVDIEYIQTINDFFKLIDKKLSHKNYMIVNDKNK